MVFKNISYPYVFGVCWELYVWVGLCGCVDVYGYLSDLLVFGSMSVCVRVSCVGMWEVLSVR